MTQFTQDSDGMKNLVYYPSNLIKKGTERMDDPFIGGEWILCCIVRSNLDSKINLLGFDLYSDDNKVNNIYKGTEGYSSPDPCSRSKLLGISK